MITLKRYFTKNKINTFCSLRRNIDLTLHNIQSYIKKRSSKECECQEKTNQPASPLKVKTNYSHIITRTGKEKTNYSHITRTELQRKSIITKNQAKFALLYDYS